MLKAVILIKRAWVCVCVQAKAMLNAVNALPQMEQADKLLARMPPAKWAAELQTAASEFRLSAPSALLHPAGISLLNRAVLPSSMHCTVSHGSSQLKENLGSFSLFCCHSLLL